MPPGVYKDPGAAARRAASLAKANAVRLARAAERRAEYDFIGGDGLPAAVAAERLGVSTVTIYEWRKRRRHDSGG